MPVYRSATLHELAQALSLPYSGNPDLRLHGVSDLKLANTCYDAAKIYFNEHANLPEKDGLQTCAFLLADTWQNKEGISALLSPAANLRENFAKLLQFFEPAWEKDFVASDDPRFSHAHVDARAEIANDVVLFPGAVVLAYAKISAGCSIYPNVSIGQHVEIAENSIIYANTSVYAGCKIGKSCILHSASVIGADGFGFHDLKDGHRIKIPQIGNVVLKDFVEVGASSTIDRATIGSTIVEEYTKIDNQVQIGHNCNIGKYVYLAGNVGIAGSVTLEDGVVLAGNVGVADHVHIEKGSVVLGMSGVPSDLKSGKGRKIYFGIPVRPATEMHRIHHALGALPQLVKQFKK